MYFAVNAAHIQAHIIYIDWCRTVVLVSQLHNYVFMYICHSITHVDFSGV